MGLGSRARPSDTATSTWLVGGGRRARRVMASCCAIAGMLLLAGCTASGPGLSFLDPRGPIAAAERTHLYGVVAIVLIVVLPVIVLTPLFAWRYRYRNTTARYMPSWGYSRPIEFVIWGVPFAIVIGLAAWLVLNTSGLDPYKPLSSDKPPLHVQVIGYDWKWLFIYPKAGIASIGQLAFPVDRPLAIELTSDTVMQSFCIPVLGSQIYAMGGRVTHLHLKADVPGEFMGENTQYNGNGFAQQKFTARAMTAADYKAWLKRVRAIGMRMTPGVYDVIRQRATKEAARRALHAVRMPSGDLYFTSVSTHLFGNVVRSFRGGPSASADLIGAHTSREERTASARPAASE